MLNLEERIRYHMLELSTDEVKYSIIFAHVCISIIHQIYFLSITNMHTCAKIIEYFTSSGDM